MTKFSKTISVIGLGYIGLPTAALFASKKFRVIGVDINENVVRIVNGGGIHIEEPGLDLLVQEVTKEGFLIATSIPQSADVFLIAVPTPFRSHSQGIPESDLTFVESACRLIAPVLKTGDLVILESTSPIGTTEKVASWLADMRPDLTFPQDVGEESDIRVAHCPERVLPGNILEELIQNDRIIGGLTSRCSEAASNLYKQLIHGACVITNSRTAEMSKLAENSFRDVNIAFANELSIVCDRLGINVWELIELANRHPRVNILKPGAGVGGHCIAVDPWFIVSAAPDSARLIKSARDVNDSKPGFVVEKVNNAITSFIRDNPNKKLKDVTVACFGIAFKPDIDDLRESPALTIAKILGETHPGTLLVVEPHISTLPPELIGISQLKSAHEALSSAQIAIILVAHKEFVKISSSIMNANLHVIDVCGLGQF